jgi:hypothetical protein
MQYFPLVLTMVRLAVIGDITGIRRYAELLASKLQSDGENWKARMLLRTLSGEPQSVIELQRGSGSASIERRCGTCAHWGDLDEAYRGKTFRPCTARGIPGRDCIIHLHETSGTECDAHRPMAK